VSAVLVNASPVAEAANNDALPVNGEQPVRPRLRRR